jgi:hypothetical protein
MNVFHCDHCQQLVFFENTVCVSCGSTLAYLPDLNQIGSLEPNGDGLWRSPLPVAQGKVYRLCDNYTWQNVCNWALPSSDPHALCRSCRLTRIIPILDLPENKEAWYKLEVAKRRLVYSLLRLGCPVESKSDSPEQGLAFEFLAENQSPGSPSILTGHSDGVITVNVAEADDVERERRRVRMHEPYRTLLGHLRHEVGHYYWDRLIKDGPRLEEFRLLFGDETHDYGDALKRHYDQGPPADWQSRFVSAYSSSHPWEDWAETWAHYLHMIDALETSAACGLSLRPPRRDEPTLKSPPPAPGSLRFEEFTHVIESWFPLTYVLNNLNRGLGLPDGYPFVLSPPAVDKLRFIHETLAAPSLGRNLQSAVPRNGNQKPRENGSQGLSPVPGLHELRRAREGSASLDTR